jgi:uncharacterized protein (TIGR02145 family)
MKRVFHQNVVFRALFAVFCFFIFLLWSHVAHAFVCGNTVSYAGKNYQTVQIGTQCWLKQNLNVGTMLGSAATLPSNNSVIEKWCYNNDPALCTAEGGLYTWAEANGLPASCNTSNCSVPVENQGICPTGWHIPTDQEYMVMEEYLGMCSGTATGCSGATGNRGTDQGAKLSLYTVNGTNSSGFSALPAGYRQDNGTFGWRGTISTFWPSTEAVAGNSWRRYLYASRDQITRYSQTKILGLSIRCLKNTINVATPVIVSTNIATEIGATTATGNASITDTGGDNPERFIEWSTVSGTYTDSCSAGIGGTGTYSCTMTNLTPNTQYFVRAKATNAAGTSYGSETSFITLGDTTIQNPNPTDIQQAVTDGYITIDNGTIDNTTSTSTNVNVTYRTTNIDALFPTGTVVTETNTNPFNFQNFTLESQNIKNEQPESRSAFRLGIEGTNLTFSQNITITTFVGEAFNTQTLDILYQNEGETTWNTHGTCTVENGQCTFQTDHATIYTINGILQSTGDAPLNINTEVLDTLTMDCYESTNGSGTYDVVLGTTTTPGTVTAGTPAIGQSTCTVTTNDDQGYYLTVEDDNGISSTVLTHTDPNTGTLYEIQDLTPWNDTTLTTENWNPPTTKGLGFSVITFPDTDTSNNIFDGIWNETGNCPEGTTSDSNDYAGFPDTPETIAAVPQYTANHTTTTICYKVDVPTSQPSGTYTGSVTYTATSDASSYVN